MLYTGPLDATKVALKHVQRECEGMGPMHYYYGNYYTVEPMHYGVS